MVAEIVSVGTELLLGQIVDTNAVYLSQWLAKLGIDLFGGRQLATTANASLKPFGKDLSELT